jgi:hypothetical protein
MSDIARGTEHAGKAHRAFAGFLSLLWPGLGLAYLGVDLQRDRWDAKCWQIFFVALAIIAGQYVFEPTPNAIVTALLVWAFVLASSGWSTWWLLKTLAAPPQPVRHWSQVLTSILVLLAVMGMATRDSRLWDLTIVAAPPTASPLIPAGTSLYAIKVDHGHDVVRRGQMVVYRDGEQIKMARVIGTPGDVVRLGSNSFLVNGVLYSPPPGFPGPLGQTPELRGWDIAEIAGQLSNPSKSDSIVGSDVLAKGGWDPPQIIASSMLLVEDDYDLAAVDGRKPTPELIELSRVVSFPISEVWSFGSQSNLAQPDLLLER